MFFIAGRVLRASSYKLFNQYKTFIHPRIKQAVGLSSFEILVPLIFCAICDFCVTLSESISQNLKEPPSGKNKCSTFALSGKVPDRDENCKARVSCLSFLIYHFSFSEAQ